MLLYETNSRKAGLLDPIREFPKITDGALHDKFACPAEPLLVQFLSAMSWDAITTNPDLERQTESMRIMAKLLMSGSGNEPPIQKLLGMGFYELLRQFSFSVGLLHPETLNNSPNDHLKKILTTHTQISTLQSEMVELKSQGKRIGIYHGSFDPAHLGHALDVRALYEYVDYVIVAIEPLWLMKKRKDGSGDSRPRVPNRLWTMAQMASIPGVDRVIELPIIEGQEIDEVFLGIMESFAAQYLCTRDDNPLLEKFRQKTDILGGKTITLRTSKPPFSLFLPQSSTQIWANMKKRGKTYLDQFLQDVDNREKIIASQLST